MSASRQPTNYLFIYLLASGKTTSHNDFDIQSLYR